MLVHHQKVPLIIHSILMLDLPGDHGHRPVKKRRKRYVD
jgi:hypothetical protein